jgi:hypothetical protein
MLYTAYCDDIDPHTPCMYEWLSKNPSTGPYVHIMRCGSTTLKSAVVLLNFRELPYELPRIPVPRTPVNGVVCSEGIKEKDDVPTIEVISTDDYRR